MLICLRVINSPMWLLGNSINKKTHRSLKLSQIPDYSSPSLSPSCGGVSCFTSRNRCNIHNFIIKSVFNLLLSYNQIRQHSHFLVCNIITSFSALKALGAHLLASHLVNLLIEIACCVCARTLKAILMTLY